LSFLEKKSDPRPGRPKDSVVLCAAFTLYHMYAR
jgi:hypothetical protein